MPVLDGIEAARRIVGGQGTENVNVLIDTADHPASVSPGLTPAERREVWLRLTGTHEDQNSRFHRIESHRRAEHARYGAGQPRESPQWFTLTGECGGVPALITDPPGPDRPRST